MRAAIILIMIGLLILTGCKNIRDEGTVVIVSDDSPAGAPSGNNPPPHAPAHGQVVKKDPPAHAPAHGQRAKNNPSPHTPAHGYRHQHEDGVELVFDSGLEVYVVINIKDMYFHNDRYLRFYNDAWHISVRFDGPWQSARESQIPDRLKKSKKPKNDKGNSKKSRS